MTAMTIDGAASPPRRAGRVPAQPPGADQPGAGRPAAGAAAPYPRAAPRGGRPAGRGRASPGTPGWSRAARSTPAPRCSTRSPARCGWTRPSGSTCSGWPTCRTRRPRPGTPCRASRSRRRSRTSWTAGAAPGLACSTSAIDLLGLERRVRRAAGPGVTGAAPGERNILLANFTYAGLLPPLRQPARAAGPAGRPVPRAYGRHVGEPAWTGFIRRLQAASPHFAELWAEHDVASPVTYLKLFRHPAFGAAGHDHHQPRRAVRALHPDGGLHARPTRSAGSRSASCWPVRAPMPSSPAPPRTASAAPNSPPPA